MELRYASRPALWLRRARVAAAQARRFARWVTEDSFGAPERTSPDGPVAATLRIPIARSGGDPRLEAGKRHNVRLAATAFHGAVIAPERPLSFWRTLGPATEARGFTWGMELRSGCAVPAIGGGLCLLSNGLFSLAVDLGWHILERHGHSIALGDRHALDATVAFPHVDLRIAPRSGTATLSATVRGDVLVLAVHAVAPRFDVRLARHHDDDPRIRRTHVRRQVWDGAALVEDRTIVDDAQRVPATEVLRTCLDCGETACRARITLPEPLDSAAGLARGNRV